MGKICAQAKIFTCIKFFIGKIHSFYPILSKISQYPQNLLFDDKIR